MSRLEWRRPLLVFSFVLGADQFSKYLWSDPIGDVSWMARARIGALALVAFATLTVLTFGAVRAGWLSPTLGAGAIAAGVSLLIDGATAASARSVFESGIGVDDLAGAALVMAAVVTLTNLVRVDDLSPAGGAEHDHAGIR